MYFVYSVLLVLYFMLSRDDNLCSNLCKCIFFYLLNCSHRVVLFKFYFNGFLCWWWNWLITNLDLGFFFFIDFCIKIDFKLSVFWLRFFFYSFLIISIIQKFARVWRVIVLMVQKWVVQICYLLFKLEWSCNMFEKKTLIPNCSNFENSYSVQSLHSPWNMKVRKKNSFEIGIIF